LVVLIHGQVYITLVVWPLEQLLKVSTYTDTNGDDPYIRFYQDDLITSNGFLTINQFNVTLRSEIHGAPVQLQGEDNGGTLRNLLLADPDNAVTLYYQGTRAVATVNVGLNVYDTTVNQTPQLSLYDSGNTLLGYLQSSTGGTIVRSVVNGGIVRFQGNNSSGTNHNLVYCDPDTAVTLYYNNTATFRTVSTTNGGIQINNTLTGSGFERPLTEGGDYEEGTYTVTATPSTSGTITMDASFNELQYIRIGKFVWVSGQIRVSSVSSPTGYFTINLPFTTEGALTDRAGYPSSVISMNNITNTNATFANQFFMIASPSASNVAIYRIAAGGNSSTSAQELQAATDIYINFMYRAN